VERQECYATTKSQNVFLFAQAVEAVKADLHLDARGWVMVPMCDVGHIAYVYATMCLPNVVKGWHRHKSHTDRLMCVSGTARIVTGEIVSGEPDMGPGSLVTSYYDFRETVCGPLDPVVVIVPPGTWHAFTPAGLEPCVIVNMPNELYDPDDEERLDLRDMPYDWQEVSK